MREIRFRGKRKDGGGWVYGDLVRRFENSIFIEYKNVLKRVLSAVKPETVGQYTGLRDKNGVRIFEGDVLLERYKEPDCDGREGILAEVVFHKGAFMIKEPGEEPEYTLGETYEDFEIVGNVFENAELLEVE